MSAISGYNPDILSCLANLSNDEVFTPPEIANAILDMLPQELFSDPTTTFLDPACKSGVFLREIAKRLLHAQLPEFSSFSIAINKKRKIGEPLSADEEGFLIKLQETIDHIYHQQLFGIAITEMTNLLAKRTVYCSKKANGKYSITHFDSEDGNIRYEKMLHTWENGKCIYCGAAQSQYDRESDLESHAYEWIHRDNPRDIWKRNFDVIISNPPFHMSDGGAKSSAKPIYQEFVDRARMCNPRYMCMIIPSRWFAGGKGLDEFRESMLNDDHIREMVDYTDSSECFPGVDIAGGVCYFLWDRDYSGNCNIRNIIKGKQYYSSRPLNEFDTFIRYSEAADIVKKVKSLGEPMMDKNVSSRKPFGLDTTVSSMENGDLVLRYNKGLGHYSSALVNTGMSLIPKWKTIISYASYDHAGQLDKDGKRKVMSVIEVLPPNSVCTETYLIAGAFESEDEAENLQKYFGTKFVRFLVAQIAVSQHITKGCFAFVPEQDFTKEWTDQMLYEKYCLSESEINFIESMIRPM